MALTKVNYRMVDGSIVSSPGITQTQAAKTGVQGMPHLTDADRTLYNESTQTYTQNNNGYWQNIQPYSSTSTTAASSYWLDAVESELENGGTQPHVAVRDWVYSGPVSGDGSADPVRLTTASYYRCGGRTNVSAKWGKDKIGTGARISWSIIPSNTAFSSLSYNPSDGDNDTSDWSTLPFSNYTADMISVFNEIEAVCDIKFDKRDFNPTISIHADLIIGYSQLDTRSSSTKAYAFYPSRAGDVGEELVQASGGNIFMDSDSTTWWSPTSSSGSPSSSEVNWRQVFRHELLHTLGFRHNLDLDSVVYPTIGTANESETFLSNGDIAGLQYLYGLPRDGGDVVVKHTIDGVEKTLATFTDNELILGEGIRLSQSSLPSDDKKLIAKQGLPKICQVGASGDGGWITQGGTSFLGGNCNPGLPCSSADDSHKLTATNSSGDKYIYHEWSASGDDASAFDVATGVYTCPEDGVYDFDFSVFISELNAANAQAGIPSASYTPATYTYLVDLSLLMDETEHPTQTGYRQGWFNEDEPNLMLTVNASRLMWKGQTMRFKVWAVSAISKFKVMPNYSNILVKRYTF